MTMTALAVIRRVIVASVLSAAVVTAPPLARPASAADPLPNRPDFRLPFDCGATVDLRTYYGHNPDDKKIDMRVVGQPTGALIRASADGYVHQEFSPGGIEIRHGNGWFTTYMHMSSHVPPGTTVKRGAVVGVMGNVGSPDYHLHYEQLYAPGLSDAEIQHIVNPVLQGEGPIYMDPENPLVRTSTNCGGGPARVLVDTGEDAAGFDVPGGVRTGTLLAGSNYVYCRSWGPEVRAGSGFNHWWLRTDLDDGPANQWVSAYYLSRWGNDEAKDNTGAEIVDCNEPYGAIGAKWRSMGGVTSVVGPPKLAETDSQRGGRFQEFVRGMIIWHPDTNAWAVYGAILDHYRALGSEDRWGFPTMDEANAAASPGGTTGRYQYMQHALFMWSPPTGVHVIHGAIHDAFAANGREAALGYPTSDEIPNSDGNGVYQTYQNATIHWTSQQGTWITR
jgi:hypothetical protein